MLHRMGIQEWWPKLKPSTHEWLIAHAGEGVPPEIQAEIIAAGGTVTPDGWWGSDDSPSGFFISDDAVDLIEEIANGEEP
jgi:hypothetical protein